MDSTASSMNSRTPTVTSKFPHGAATPNSLPRDSTKEWVSTAAQRVGLTRANTDGHTPKGASEQARVPGRTDSSNTAAAAASRTAPVIPTDKPLPFPPIVRVTTNASPTKLSRTLLDASEKPLKMAAGTPQEQEWPALYPEKASTPGTLKKFADQHPIPQFSNLNRIRQKFDQGPKPASNNPPTARAKDHNSVNRLNTPCPIGKRMKETTGGKENQARTARGNTNKQPLNVAATGRAPQMHLTLDVSPSTSADSLTKSECGIVPSALSGTSFLHDQMSGGRATNHRSDGVGVITGFMARPLPHKSGRRLDNTPMKPKLAHFESRRSSVRMDSSSPNAEVDSIASTGVSATNIKTADSRLHSSSRTSSVSVDRNAAGVDSGRDQQLRTDTGSKRSSIPVLMHYPSPTMAQPLERESSSVRAPSAALFTNVSSTGETRWPLLNNKPSSESGGKSTVHDYGPNTDMDSDEVVTMRDGPKRHSDIFGTAPCILPRASSTASRSASRLSPASFDEVDLASRASMESRTSGARVKQADNIILGESSGMPDVPSIHTDLYRQAVQNGSRQTVGRDGQQGKPASPQTAEPRTGIPNSRKQPRKSPPANQASKVMQTSFGISARQPILGPENRREDTRNHQATSKQAQHQCRNPTNSEESSPVEQRHVSSLGVHPSRSSSFASARRAKVNSSSMASSKESERDRSSESQSSPELAPNLAVNSVSRSETHKVSAPPTNSWKASTAQSNFIPLPPEHKNMIHNGQEKTNPELPLSINHPRASRKEQSPIDYPSRLQPGSLRASNAEYSSHRSTFVPGVCASPDQIPERITDSRLSSDFKTAGMGHHKPRYSQATFSSKAYTDCGSMSKAKIAMSIRNFFHKHGSNNILKLTENKELAKPRSNFTPDGSSVARNGRLPATFQRIVTSRGGRTPTPTPAKKDASSPTNQGSHVRAMVNSPIPESPASDLSSKTPSLVRYVREAANTLPSGAVERFRLLNVAEIIMSTVENAKRAEIHAQEARANAVEAKYQSELAQLAVKQIRQMMGKGTGPGEGTKSLLRLSEARKAGRRGDQSGHNKH